MVLILAEFPIPLMQKYVPVDSEQPLSMNI